MSERLFSSLPEGLRQHYYQNSLVHAWVDAWLSGKVEYEAMLAYLAEALAVQLTERNELLTKIIRLLPKMERPIP